MLLIFTTGCSADYQISTVITGEIEDINKEKELLIILGKFEGNDRTFTFEIPARNLEQYEIGQKVEVTIYSNTDQDIWDPDNMKFEIKKINDY